MDKESINIDFFYTLVNCEGYSYQLSNFKKRKPKLHYTSPLTLPQASRISSHYISVRSVSILSLNLCFDLPNVLGFPILRLKF
jgi:hypothetical protein